MPNQVLAGPSDAFKKLSECIENPDFVTPKSERFKYCIDSNGTINKINEEGVLVQEKGELNKTIEDRKRRGLFGSSTDLYEYKIEDEELVQYKCKAKQVDSKYQCDGPGERFLKGVRPDEYYLEEGLRKIEDEKWEKAIEDFSAEIKSSKSKDAYYQRAYAKFMLKDYVGTIKDASSSLEEDRKNIKAYNLRSMAKYEISDHKGAIIDLNKLIVLFERLSKEEKAALDIKETNPLFNKFYFRRALSKSETGDKNGASKDFDQAIENHPLHGQAYFQRGLESYWEERDTACSDILKGLSLGAEDTSDLIIKEKANGDSFLNELFEEETTLVSNCKGESDKKVDKNKDQYEFEKLTKKASELLRRYFILIPIFALVIVSIFVKYSSKDD